METRVAECSALFMEKLGGFARRGEMIDMAQWLQWFAFDVVGAVTVSAGFHSMNLRSSGSECSI